MDHGEAPDDREVYQCAPTAPQGTAEPPRTFAALAAVMHQAFGNLGGPDPERSPSVSEGEHRNAGAALSLVQENSNSTAQSPEEGVPDGAYPKGCGGKFDPLHGKAARLRDLRCIDVLSHWMRKPIFLTLTPDRKAWTREKIKERYQAMSPGERKKLGMSSYQIETLPEEEVSYHMAGLRVSRLLTQRLGLPLWCRVIEPQTESGNGWIHWHIVAEAFGTRWSSRSGWINLKKLNAAIRRAWIADWGGGRFDLQLAHSSEKVAGYLAKYLVKGWPAIPPWVLHTKRALRLVGFSSEAGRCIRDSIGGGSGTRPKNENVKRRRPRRPLIDRLPDSGLSCVVIRDGRYVTTLPVRQEDLIAAASEIDGVELEQREYQNYRGIVKRCVPVIHEGLGVWCPSSLFWRSDDLWNGFLGRLMVWMDRVGRMDQIEDERKRRRQALLDGWWQLQSSAC